MTVWSLARPLFLCAVDSRLLVVPFLCACLENKLALTLLLPRSPLSWAQDPLLPCRLTVTTSFI